MERIRAWLGGWRSDIANVRRKGSFARNALYTFSDAFANILSQIVLTPLVAALYGPVAYGIYGLFSTITTNLSTLAGLGLPGAFMLPRDERGFQALARTSIALLVLVVVAVAPICLFPSLLYAVLPSWSVMGRWCMAVPAMVLLLGLTQVLVNWSARVKAFALYARIGPATSVGMRLFNLGYGLLRKGTLHGLILGELVVRTLAVAWFFAAMRKHGLRPLLRGYGRAEAVGTLKAYREYPLYIFPGRWLALFASQLPILGIITFLEPGPANTAAVGHFTLAGSLLLMPLRLFGYSLSMVFLRKITEAQADDPASVGPLTQRLYDRFLALGLLPFTFLTFFGDEVFRLVLGEAWREAGVYSAAMGLFYLFRLLSEPIVSVYNAQRSERALFRFYLALFVVNAAAVAYGILHLRSAYATVMAFAAVNLGAYLYLSCRILRNTGRPWARVTLRTGALIAVACLAFGLLRRAVLGTWTPF
ncbi:MAG: lipopolysaccharide biosynthesis protein [Bacteroidetes bacterium]|nr:lipopolysaccharide biosynthesis protein [Bacteroidota bacterium]